MRAEYTRRMMSDDEGGASIGDPLAPSTRACYAASAGLAIAEEELAMSRLTIPVPVGQPSFANVARCDDLDALDAEIAILGVPYGYPYDMDGAMQPSGTAPKAIRAES